MKNPTLHRKMREKISRLIKNSYKRKGLTMEKSVHEIIGNQDWDVIINNLTVTFSERYGQDLTLENMSKITIHHKIFLETAKTTEEVNKLNKYTNLELLTVDDHNQLHWKLRWEEHARIKELKTNK